MSGPPRILSVLARRVAHGGPSALLPQRSLTPRLPPPAQVRSYALSRNPNQGPRFSRSPSASSRRAKDENGVSASSQLSETEPNPALFQPVVLPRDPEGVLQEHGDDGAAVLLGQSALVVTRELEMMNVFMGFEQANRYSLLSPTGAHVGYLAEEETGVLGGALQRQVLKTHRPFRATVMDAQGRQVLHIRRPFTFINSRAYVHSTISGKLIGEAQQSWHPWRRRYDLFVNRPPVDTPDKEQFVQFAKVDAPLLSWDFYMQDQDEKLVGAINRNFRGFGREIFTDTGQYVVRFDAIAQDELLAPRINAPVEPGQPGNANPNTAASGTALVTSPGTRSLTLDERAVALANAVSIDFDYFSRHSGSGGMMPFFWFGGGGSDAQNSEREQGQDSSGVQAPPPVPGADGGMGPAVGTGIGYGLGSGMYGGGRGESGSSSGADVPRGDDGASGQGSYPPPEAGAPSGPETGGGGGGSYGGSAPERGIGGEEVWGESGADPWAGAGDTGAQEEGGMFDGWGWPSGGLSDFLPGDGDDGW